MLKKTLSTVMAFALVFTMSFSVSEKVLAVSEDLSVEDNSNGLVVEFVDKLDDLNDDLEQVSVEELPSDNTLESHTIPDIVLSDDDCMGDEIRSSRADGISMMYSDQSITVDITGTINAADRVSYIPVALAPGDILQATLKLPNNAELDYDLLLYAFDNDTLGDYIKGSTLTTYMNTYPDGTTKTVDEAIAYINNDNVVHSYAVIVFPAKGYSTTESFGLTISLDQAGYYDASEPNESPFDVKTVTSNTNIVGNNLNVINDQDWFVISTTGVQMTGFVVSESSYSVEVYYAIDKSMVLVNPNDGVYNLSKGNYYIKVFNKNIDFVSKDYTLNIPIYGNKPVRMEVYYDGDMDQQKFNYHQGEHYAFQYTLLPIATLYDAGGKRVPNVNVTLEWTGDTAISPNNGHQTQMITTDQYGRAFFRMRVPQAHGIHNYKNVAINFYDYDNMTISCGDHTYSIYLYHMRER